MSESKTDKSDEWNDEDDDGLDIFEDAEERAYKKYEGKPVDPPLCEIMGVDIMVNEKSQIWIMHDKSFNSRLDWVEYDWDDDTITFVKKGGVVQTLGMKIQKPIKKLMKKATKVYTMCVEDGQISNFFIVVLAIRKSGILYKRRGTL